MYERLLTTYAYNILGSYEDAKDVVQDAYLRFIQRKRTELEDERAYLIRTVINLSINSKNRQKRERESYPGEWLPEPVATEYADSLLNRKEILSYSLMVLLEKLTAKQRAVFILKEAFAYDHKEIAEVLDITEENSRKLLNRAKEQLQALETITPSKQTDAYLDKYLSVIQNADMPQLEKMLHEEVMVISDGGGKVAAFRKPITGRDDVAKLLQGVYAKFYTNVDIRKILINNQPALCYFQDGRLINCQVFALQKNVLRNIYFIRNPDKLKELEKNLLKSVTF